MKRYILLLIVLVSAQLQAQVIGSGKFSVQNIQMNLNESSTNMRISMDIYHKYDDIKTNNWITLIPKITNGSDTVALDPLFFYGRGAYYNFIRNNRRVSKEMRFMAKSAANAISYSTEIPFETWMDTASVVIFEKSQWCCNYPSVEASANIYTRESTIKIDYEPDFVYVIPKAEVVKSRSISASAYINFPAGKTDIDPYYGNNRKELAKIMATVDSVRTDNDITVSLLSLKGYASPEGMYDRNVELSGARTESLKNYIVGLAPQLYGVVKSESVPENWDDLRRFVEKSDISHKSEILEVINSTREPDNKEWVLKSRYKTEYKYLLEVCYPLLRRTDYTISYTIRSYTNPEEIVKIMFEAPQKLSLNEFYLASQALEEGSPRYREAFEIAVRMFPNDEVANLNAANIAMADGNLAQAERYLAKAGESVEAEYARGVYYALSENYEEAELYFSKCSDAIPQAKEALAIIGHFLK
ncbi:MAG: hypothetical protein IKY70_04190 [Bacteroidales bacterium]|nr:hypothetical protein [Bacteroidales bacterium]